MQFSRLPALVQDIVFEFLAENDTGLESRQRNGDLFRYALVCKEWQCCFEEMLYKHLTIKSGWLHRLKEVPVRRRRSVKHIWLQMDLLQYTPRDNHNFQAVRSSADNMGVRGFLRRLFATLADWEDHDRASCPKSLTLEVSACSVSDRNYHGELDFDSNSWAAQQEVDFSSEDDASRPTTPRSLERIAELFTYSDFFLPPMDTFCRVHMVRGLVLRRQTRRTLHPEILAEVVRALPNLESVCYEPWYCDQGKLAFAFPSPRRGSSSFLSIRLLSRLVNRVARVIEGVDAV